MVVVKGYDRRQPLEDVGAVPPPRMHTINTDMPVVESGHQMVMVEKVPLSSIARDGFGSGVSPSQAVDGLVSLPIIDQSLDVAVSLDVVVSSDLKVQNPLPPNFEEVLVDIDKEIKGRAQLGNGARKHRRGYRVTVMESDAGCGERRRCPHVGAPSEFFFFSFSDSQRLVLIQL